MAMSDWRLFISMAANTVFARCILWLRMLPFCRGSVAQAASRALPRVKASAYLPPYNLARRHGCILPVVFTKQLT